MSLLKSGKYKFYVSGLIDTDKDGNNLSIKSGNNTGSSFRKIRLSLIGIDGLCSEIYHPVFGSDKVKEIANAIGKNFSATDKVGLKDLDSFFGESGSCLIVTKEGKNGAESYNDVSLFIPKKAEETAAKTVAIPAVFNEMVDKGMGAIEVQAVRRAADPKDDIPF